jgi:hypothetical protein
MLFNATISIPLGASSSIVTVIKKKVDNIYQSANLLCTNELVLNFQLLPEIKCFTTHFLCFQRYYYFP